MSDESQAVRVEELDWASLFPFVRLFRAFRMAVFPPTKLLLALGMVAVLWIGGQIISAPTSVYPGEFANYARLDVDDFQRWLSVQQTRHVGKESALFGVFDETVRIKLDAYERLLGAATRFDLGIDEWLREGQPHPDTMGGAIYELAVLLPGWLWTTHKGFFFLYGLLAIGVWGYIGGAIARVSAAQASRDETLSVQQALGFARGYWGWFVVTPMMPWVLAGLVALIPILGGLIFFNLPVWDLIGGMLFVVAVLCGGLITILLLLHLLGWHLYYPAIAIEGTDGFDACSRVFGYIWARPGKWLFYNLVSVAYGAVAYVLVAIAVCLTLGVTQYCVKQGVFVEVEGVNRFDAIMPVPQHGGWLDQGPAYGDLSFWGRGVAWMVRCWVYLVIGLVPAFAISFYFSVNTWVYLLLRQSVDGTDYGDMFAEPATLEEQITWTESTEVTRSDSTPTRKDESLPTSPNPEAAAGSSDGSAQDGGDARESGDGEESGPSGDDPSKPTDTGA